LTRKASQISVIPALTSEKVEKHDKKNISRTNTLCLRTDEQNRKIGFQKKRELVEKKVNIRGEIVPERTI
jgi:hypothetical protein